MLVKVFSTLNEWDEFDINSSSIKEILNYIKSVKDKSYTDNLLENNFKYLLVDSTGEMETLALFPEVIMSELPPYDSLYIIPEISGNAPITALALVDAGIFAEVGFAASATAFALNIVVAVAASYAINTVMSLISPTPTFSNDPSQSQKYESQLFNGAPMIREQGGSVPIILGNPFCGGVLISSSITTADH